jgi:hypothetical protein
LNPHVSDQVLDQGISPATRNCFEVLTHWLRVVLKPYQYVRQVLAALHGESGWSAPKRLAIARARSCRRRAPTVLGYGGAAFVRVAEAAQAKWTDSGSRGSWSS